MKSKWTLEEAHKIAKKYKTRNEFRKNYYGCYLACCRNNWLDKICSHMISGRDIIKSKWTFAEAHKIAKKYKTRSEFRKDHYGCYLACCRNNWLDKICSHMISGRDIMKSKWTLAEVRKIAKKYKTRSEFRKDNYSCYLACCRNNWLGKVCSNMPEYAKQNRQEDKLKKRIDQTLSQYLKKTKNNNRKLNRGEYCREYYLNRNNIIDYVLYFDQKYGFEFKITANTNQKSLTKQANRYRQLIGLKQHRVKKVITVTDTGKYADMSVAQFLEWTKQKANNL